MASILDGIAILGQENEGLDDKQTHEFIKKAIYAMENQGKAKWPSNRLCKLVFDMEKPDKRMFYTILCDMDQALEDAYGLIEKGENDG